MAMKIVPPGDTCKSSGCRGA